MASITTRAAKGTKLSHIEGDNNLNNLNSEVMAATANVAALTVAMSSLLVSGEWKRVPSLMRLRLAGTGTCVVDSKNALDEVTTELYTYTATGATNQIEYPYLGDDAVYIRVTLTDTCTAEVL